MTMLAVDGLSCGGSNEAEFPPLVDPNLASETVRGLFVHPLSAARHHTRMDPGWPVGLCGRALRLGGTGNGIAALVSDEACGIRHQVPRSTLSA